MIVLVVKWKGGAYGPIARSHGNPYTTQMNTRIDRTLKSQGDEVLARFGYTPSQAIRGLYRFRSRPQA